MLNELREREDVYCTKAEILKWYNYFTRSHLVFERINKYRDLWSIRNLLESMYKQNNILSHLKKFYLFHKLLIELYFSRIIGSEVSNKTDIAVCFQIINSWKSIDSLIFLLRLIQCIKLFHQWFLILAFDLCFFSGFPDNLNNLISRTSLYRGTTQSHKEMVNNMMIQRVSHASHILHSDSFYTTFSYE